MQGGGGARAFFGSTPGAAGTYGVVRPGALSRTARQSSTRPGSVCWPCCQTTRSNANARPCVDPSARGSPNPMVLLRTANVFPRIFKFVRVDHPVPEGHTIMRPLSSVPRCPLARRCFLSLEVYHEDNFLVTAQTTS